MGCAITLACRRSEVHKYESIGEAALIVENPALRIGRVEMDLWDEAANYHRLERSVRRLAKPEETLEVRRRDW